MSQGFQVIDRPARLIRANTSALVNAVLATAESGKALLIPIGPDEDPNEIRARIACNRRFRQAGLRSHVRLALDRKHLIAWAEAL